jgi:uncharacterized protein (TIGR03663 family)
MLHRAFICLAWIAVMGIALWLRVESLEARPIHADEATGAHIFSQLIENSNYRFDPTHFHGPLLSLSTWPVAKIFGQNNWQELSLSMLRTGPVLAGLLMVLTPLLWLKSIGPRAALAAAALLACSPLLVYYNRMYIHESWLALFGMVAAAAIFYLIKNPSRNRALLAGLAAGLMFATKETVVISLLCWAVAGAVCWLIMKSNTSGENTTPPMSAYLKPAVWFTACLLAVGTVFYTNGLREPGGIIDALRTYFVYETTPGHDKPFGYYFDMLVLPKHVLGMWWSEGIVALLGILACVIAALRKTGRAVIAFIAIGALLHLLIYSLISYKTPWLMSLPWALACLLAGCAFSRKTRSESTPGLLLLYVCFGLGLFYQGQQALQASGRLSNHPDNPYAYVPTSKNMTQLPGWLKELEDFQGGQNIEPIAVIGRGYWPLPWYLRDFDPVGYWSAPPEAISTFPIVFSMPADTASCGQILAETHTRLPRSLRSNVPITLFLKNEIWAAWTEQPSNK